MVSEQDWQKDRHLVEEAISVRERNIHVYINMHIQYIHTVYGVGIVSISIGGC